MKLSHPISSPSSLIPSYSLPHCCLIVPRLCLAADANRLATPQASRPSSPPRHISPSDLPWLCASSAPPWFAITKAPQGSLVPPPPPCCLFTLVLLRTSVPPADSQSSTFPASPGSSFPLVASRSSLPQVSPHSARPLPPPWSLKPTMSPQSSSPAMSPWALILAVSLGVQPCSTPSPLVDPQTPPCRTFRTPWFLPPQVPLWHSSLLSPAYL